MELKEPDFMKTKYVYFTEDGVQIKENSPAWVRNQYEKFKKELNKYITE